MTTDTMDSRQFGLEAGQLVARFFLQTEDLHWGLWPEGLEVSVPNMPVAQARHSDLIRKHIPEGTQTILDVGGGSGQFAESLVAAGYAVDVVSPSEHLAARISERLPDESHVYVCRFEDVVPRIEYDLVLFSESFQYVKLEAGMARIEACSRPGSHILVCDYFRMGKPGKPPVGGGHKWAEVEAALAGQPLELVTSVDVTDEAAPTCQLLGDFMEQVAGPLKGLAGEYMTQSHPMVAKMLGWKLKKKLAKVDRKYFSGRFNADAFREHFTYQLLLWRRTSD
jgi:SAM-dependent methyltransferase